MYRILLFTALMGFACMPLMAAGPMSILGKVQRKGQEQAVANNLKQLATMLIMYAGDHNNRLPAAAGAAGLAELRPYGASDKLLIVPYDYVSKAANGDKLTEANTSYAYLGNAVGELSKIRKPSVIPLIIEKTSLKEGGDVQIAFCDGHVALKKFGPTTVAGVVKTLMKESGSEKDPVWQKLIEAAAALDAKK